MEANKLKKGCKLYSVLKSSQAFVRALLELLQTHTAEQLHKPLCDALRTRMKYHHLLLKTLKIYNQLRMECRMDLIDLIVGALTSLKRAEKSLFYISPEMLYSYKLLKIVNLDKPLLAPLFAMFNCNFEKL